MPKSVSGISFRNGLNGNRMINNPKSRYSRILKFVTACPGASKREILNACNMTPAIDYRNPSVRFDALTAPSHRVRGQHGYIFRYMILSGALRMKREGNNVLYYTN